MNWSEEYYKEQPNRRSWIGYVLGVWLTGVFTVSLLGRIEAGRDGVASLPSMGVAVVWPLAYFVMNSGRVVPAAMPPAAAIAVVVFGVASALSSFFSPVPLLSTGYVVMTLASVWLAMLFNSHLDSTQYRRGFSVFAVLTGGLLVGFAWYDYVPGTRLGTGKDVLNPNTVALVATSVVLAAMGIKTLLMRLAIIVPVVWIIVLTGSRAAALAVVTGLVMVAALRLRARSRSVLLAAAMALVLAVGVAALYGEAMYRSLDRYYALSTADRGLASGATGRLTAWKETWDLFVRNPALGIGFRAHEHVLKADTSSHNGYLATLAEIGLPGFLSVVYLVWRALRRWWGAAHEPDLADHASILFGLCVGYLLLALFERYLINVGNPTSLMFLLAVMHPGVTAGDAAGEEEPEPDSKEGRVVGELAQEASG